MDQKLSIASELHSYINQLRDLKGDYIGAIDRGKAKIGQIASIGGGPFDSEQQFNEFILGDIVESAPDIQRHYAKFALIDDHGIVFTHADFSPRDILVEGGRVTAILDWEYAGWYPEHWEYIPGASATDADARLARISVMYFSTPVRERIYRHVLPSSSLTPLADIATIGIMQTFRIRNAMPLIHWNARKAVHREEQHAEESVLRAELGSFPLEFTRLSQITGNPKYFDAAQRVMEMFDKKQDTTRPPGL